MKTMKSILLVIISFFAVGVVANAEAKYDMKEITLSGLNKGEYDLVRDPDKSKKYDESVGGFWYVGKTFTCKNGLESDSYIVTTSGKIKKYCGSTTSTTDSKTYTDLEFKEVNKKQIINKVVYLKSDDSVQTSSVLKNDADYTKVSSVVVSRLYDDVVRTLYVVRREAEAGAPSLGILDNEGNVIVPFGAYSINSDIEITNAASLKKGNDYIIASGNSAAGKYETLSANNLLYAGDLKDAKYTGITVSAATPEKNYYVAEIKSKFYIFDSSAFVKDSSGANVVFDYFPNLKNVGGNVLYLYNKMFYNLDGSAYTKDTEKTTQIENDLLYAVAGNNISFKTGNKEVYSTSKSALGVNDNELSIQYLGKNNGVYYFGTFVPSDDTPIAEFELQLFALSSTGEEDKKDETSKEDDKTTEEDKKDETSKEEDKKEDTTTNGDKKEESSTTPKYSCEIKDGKYYSKDGSVVDKKTYESVCGLTDNPHTGIALPIILVVALAGIGAFVYKTKGKDLFKKI